MEENKTYIYGLLCPKSNQVRYIGKSNNPKKRLDGHFTEKGNTKKCNWLKSLKHKNLKPTIILLDFIEEKDWQFWEQHYISLYKSWGFKLVNGDNGGLGSSRLTQEVKDKISKANKGYIPSQETINKILISRKGYKHSEETKQKISKSNSKTKGPQSKEHIENRLNSIKVTLSKRKYKFKSREKRRVSIICLNIKTNVEIEIKGITEASKLLNIGRTSIDNNLSGLSKLVNKQYKFSYKC